MTVRAEASATTEAGFFKTLIERQHEAQKHLNELAAQLSQQNTATRSTQGKPHSAERRNKHTPGSLSLWFFSCIMSESEEWWFDVRPKAVGNDLAPSMSSVLKALSRAAHLMQQWPDGTKHSRRV